MYMKCKFQVGILKVCLELSNKDVEMITNIYTNLMLCSYDFEMNSK